MKLLVDVGNTTTEFALLKEEKFCYIDKIHDSLIDFNSIKEMLRDIKPDEIYISTVAPYTSNKLQEIFLGLYGIKSIIVSNRSKVDFKIEIDNPDELGVDLLCDLVAGYQKYGPKLAIVDFGTATKILFIDIDSSFKSCAIFLGFDKSKRILANSTELLPVVDDIEVKPISECHNTNDVINSSSYYSQLFTVNGIIAKFENEVGYKLNRIYTGGNADYFLKDLGDAHYEPHLVLQGLAILSERK